MDFINGMRYGFLMLTRGARYSLDFLKLTNRRFCNSPDRIIGWHRGYPSFYLLSPPVMSRPSANSLVTRIMSIYQWRKLPDLLSFAITPECNCDCAYCSFTGMRKGDRPLETGEIISAIRQAQDLGVVTVNLVGGEPLMHPDLAEIIRSVDPDLSQVILFTNGYHLEERAGELRRAGLTSVIVSIDSADPAAHNAKKGLSGLFERAVAGIARARKEKLLTGMSTVVERGDTENGNLVRIFGLGRRLKVNEILLFDAVPAGNYAGRTDLGWTAAELGRIIALSGEYHRKRGYPGIHSYTYSKSGRGIGCAGGVNHFYISPWGDVCPCDFNPQSMGSVRDEPLHALWDRFSADPNYRCSSLGGCRMQDPGFRKHVQESMKTGKMKKKKRP